STDPRSGNGSTMIASHLLSRLPDDITLSLVYYEDRGLDLDEAVAHRARHVLRLPIRGRKRSAAALPFTSLPRASWQRATRQSREAIARLDERADVVFLHGIHAFGCLPVLSA